MPMFVLLLCAAGCTSALDRFEDGQELEQQGRWAEAAEHYIAALDKDPSLTEARTRLLDAGARAIALQLQRAGELEAAARHMEAADRMLQAEELRSRSAEVDVELALPADYAGTRQRLLDRAVTAALESGLDAVQRQDFDAARRWYSRADRYRPTPARRAELERARFDAAMAWGEAELARGNYRAAHERAGEALAILPRDAAARSRVEQLQQAALERGTRDVAIIPVWATELPMRNMPTDLLAELNDELELEHWTAPPLFVRMVPSADVTRELRRAGLTRRVLSTAEAASTGRRLRAHYVVVAEVDSASRTETDVRSVRRAVKTNAGVDTAFTIEQGRQRSYVRIAFAIVDPDANRVLDSGTVSESVTTEFRRPSYSGDPRTLNLTRADRDLFDSAAGAVDRDTVTRLAQELAPRLARAVYERLERR